MITVEYSKLQYKPSVTEEELIYVGLATHLYDDTYKIDEREVEIIKNKNRLYSFNDELDKNVINIILDAIKREWESDNLLSSHNNYSSFNEFTRRHVSNFNFSPIEKAVFDTLEMAKKFIEDTVRYLLNYSIDKKDRMSTAEKDNYLKNIFTSRYENVSKNKKILAKETKEKVTFDFVISDKSSERDVYIKELNVNNQLNHTMRSYAAFSHFNDYQIIFSVGKNFDKIPDSVKKYAEMSDNIIVAEEQLVDEVTKFIKDNKSENLLV